MAIKVISVLSIKKASSRTSLVAWQFKFCASTAERVGLIHGGGTNIPHAVWDKKKKKRTNKQLKRNPPPHSPKEGKLQCWKAGCLGYIRSFLQEPFQIYRYLPIPGGFPHSSVGKESACNAGDPGSIPGLGRSSGEGNGNPLKYSCLENPTDRRAWQATVHGVTRVGHDLAT